MKSQNLQEFRKELNATERLGCKAVRNLCTEAIEKWEDNCVQLADLADIIIQEADLIDLNLLETGHRVLGKDEELIYAMSEHL